ncbi:transcriptional regulator [Staphylococcus arlettae]|uniref:Transcriptional regulator n=1 Tax=Staphylococcus arlettae TaxID=29378 RepID=A0A380BTV4_9STAP|nr:MULTISPECIES: MarR family transcriptional regulator [Staphylococcus]MBF0737811.1 transcriptional regulator [Staphylococcus arlettae]MBK3719863.1 MarR family protein [Staphylococcus arlettae]MCD8849462.1 winged helix DNA-binding protein [Staphylococcus arlettae]MEB5899097.1 winged helix DNA-binding protein [Staphylococcus arlettae]PNZ53000.1 transcriptional regulator [Staphylococcus arlettae]
MSGNQQLHELDFIDLLSERHAQLRQLTETAANVDQESKISSSEWYIISIIGAETYTLSELTALVKLTRQAIHKTVKQLEQKELVVLKAVTGNKKEKCVNLTTLGRDLWQRNQAYQQELEQHIKTKIGVAQFEQLKALLQTDWDLPTIAKK